MRQIAVLSGKSPQQFQLAASNSNIFAKLPSAPSGFYPSDLLTNRPDIRARQAQVNALAAQAERRGRPGTRFGINFGALNGGNYNWQWLR